MSEHFALVSAIAEANNRIRALEDALRGACDELRIIATAKPNEWGGDVRDQFLPWAQNRARHRLAEVDIAARALTEEPKR